MPDVDPDISAAVNFLAKAQLATGEFRTLIGSSPAMSNAVFDSSPFATTFVIHALGHVRAGPTQAMIDRALAFLLSEKEFGGLWRYYGRTQYKHCRVPPDLDDTACVGDALRRNGRRPPANRWLFRANRDAQGRFLTWVVPKPDAPALSPLRIVRAIADWQAERARRVAPRPAVATDARLLTTDADPVPIGDVDPMVNANAVLYLGEGPDTQPAIDWLNAIATGAAAHPPSLYYKDELSLYYMIARAYRCRARSLGAGRDNIVIQTMTRRQPDGTFGSILSTALALSVLLTFAPQHGAIDDAISFIRQTQNDDGSWAAQPFYSGPTEFWGSPELTTALCLEALARAAFH